MHLRQSVISEGVEYFLLYRLTGTPATCWAWVDAVTRCRVSPEDVERLRDAFLSDDTVGLGRSTPPREVRRLYEVLISMGAPRDRILRRLGVHEPRKCVGCREFTTDGYAGPRCEMCHEQFVRTSRIRNTTNTEVSGGSMNQSGR
jgi:hypothetical protein